MTKVRDIAEAIESFAPLGLQESYDNAGLQVGDPDMEINAVLICLDVTESILREALKRGCNMIVSHHPLIFNGLKSITGKDQVQRIVIESLLKGIAVYSAHTNLDLAKEGVSYEMARMLGLKNLVPLKVSEGKEGLGLGVLGESQPVPRIEFLRKLKEVFDVKEIKYSGQSPQLVIRKVALCGGSGASMIRDAVAAGADCYVTGDVKYHDFTSYGDLILLADIGHYESELCSRKIFSGIIRSAFPDCVTYISEAETNPVKYL